MRFVVIDLVPALLRWEGRDAFPVAEADPAAADVVDELFPDYRLAAVTDGDRPGAEVREALERLELGEFFETVLTSSAFGPTVTPRIIRRITSAIGAAEGAIVVTGRPGLAAALRAAGIPTIEVAPGGLQAVPDAVRALEDGRFSP